MIVIAKYGQIRDICWPLKHVVQGRVYFVIFPSQNKGCCHKQGLYFRAFFVHNRIRAAHPQQHPFSLYFHNGKLSTCFPDQKKNPGQFPQHSLAKIKLIMPPKTSLYVDLRCLILIALLLQLQLLLLLVFIIIIIIIIIKLLL